MTHESTRDYARIERAIRFLEQNAHRQPELSEVAEHLHLSEFHAQRLFSRWAGISPKRFLQFVTAERAKPLLEESRNVLEVTHDTGLSNPSRLHNLILRTEGMTPGEYGSGGEGLRIAYGVVASPFGTCLLAATEHGICDLHFMPQEDDAERLVDSLRSRFPRADLDEDSATIEPLAERAFRPFDHAPTEPFYLLVKGTNFQIKVWRALLEIPAGAVISYGDLARRIDRPEAARAVASAVARNPVQYLIPCHRVIRQTGAFGGYQGGVTRKKALLVREMGRA